MKDPLKQYIDTHRDAFDDANPDPRVWEKIAQGIAMKPAPVRSLRRFPWALAAAAAVLAAVTIPLFFHFRGARAARPETAVVADTATDSTALYDQELYHFTQIVRLKARELEQIKGAHPELYQRFAGDLQKLDSSYQQLRQDLSDQPDQEVVLQAMLQNLTLQVELINRQLDIIEQLKQDSHARTTSQL